MQDIGGAPAPANPAAVYSELGGVAGSADDLPNVSGTVAVDDNDDGWGVLKLNHDVGVMMVGELETGTGRRRKRQKKLQW